MKDKKELLYKRALMTCVIMLFISILLKLFGSNIFDLNTNIEVLNKIDKVIMDSTLLSFVYSFILLFINGYMVCLISTKIGNIKRYILPLTLVCVTSIVSKAFINLNFLSFLIDTIGLLLVCIYVTNDLKIVKEYILVFILNVIYQILSLFIRDLGFHLSSYGVTISTLLMLDYYIMIFITYFYLKKGDITLWESFHHFGSSLVKRLWKKHLQNLEQCSSKGEHKDG